MIHCSGSTRTWLLTVQYGKRNDSWCSMIERNEQIETERIAARHCASHIKAETPAADVSILHPASSTLQSVYPQNAGHVNRKTLTGFFAWNCRLGINAFRLCTCFAVFLCILVVLFFAFAEVEDLNYMTPQVSTHKRHSMSLFCSHQNSRVLLQHTSIQHVKKQQHATDYHLDSDTSPMLTVGICII